MGSLWGDKLNEQARNRRRQARARKAKARRRKVQAIKHPLRTALKSWGL